MKGQQEGLPKALEKRHHAAQKMALETDKGIEHAQGEGTRQHGLGPQEDEKPLLHPKDQAFQGS